MILSSSETPPISSANLPRTMDPKRLKPSGVSWGFPVGSGTNYEPAPLETKCLDKVSIISNFWIPCCQRKNSAVPTWVNFRHHTSAQPKANSISSRALLKFCGNAPASLRLRTIPPLRWTQGTQPKWPGLIFWELCQATRTARRNTKIKWLGGFRI